MLLVALCVAASAMAQTYEGHEYVDLGLPSGLLWATMNVGATVPEGAGEYYAWGDTVPITSRSTGYAGNPETLPFEADAARQSWGGDWRMPTQAEMQELIDECVWEKVTVNDMACWKVSGNGASIYLPLGGFKRNTNLSVTSKGDRGDYWTSTLASNNNPWRGYFTNSKSVHSGSGRALGFLIRPVYQPNTTMHTLTVTAGEGGSVSDVTGDYLHGSAVTVTATPNEGYYFQQWSDGEIANERTIMVTEDDMELTAEFAAYVPVTPGYVDLGFGTLWATFNVGASVPEEAGIYFAWGETTPVGSSYGYKENPSVLLAENDAASVHWGGDWRTPTKDEFDDLAKKCDWEKITDGDNVYWKVSNKTDATQYILLPVCGYKSGSAVSSVGTRGDYLSANSDGDKCWYLQLGNSKSNGANSGGSRNIGRVVRPVQSKKYEISIAADDGGSVTGGGTSMYVHGQEIVLNATPSAGYVFLNWTDASGEVVATLPHTTIPATYATTYTAHFTQPTEVDLGLTSGTLWSATNLGATEPKEAGDYYAWGEIETKVTYTYTENPLTLPLVDRDAVYKHMGGDWHMPTEAELQELIDECDWTKETDDEGVVYWKVSKKGDASTYIILPVCGFKRAGSSEPVLVNTRGDYLSSTLNTADVAKCWYLELGSTKPTEVNRGGTRSIGRAIRPVRGTERAIEFAAAEGGSMEIIERPTKYFYGTKVKVTATPEEGWVFLNWTDENGTVVSSTETTTITITESNTYTANFTKPTYVDLGFGTLWATFNVGASVPEEAGAYFAYDDARISWGEEWHIPTKVELEDLVKNCAWDVVEKVVEDETVVCFEVTSKINNNSILLPVCGFKRPNASSPASVNTRGDYWSSTVVDDQSAYFLQIIPEPKGYSVSAGGSRDVARVIRPVQTKRYAISVEANNSAYGNVSGGGENILHGSSIEIHATANEGHVFRNWTDDAGNVVSTSESDTIIVTESATYTANFVALEYVDLGFGTFWATFNVGATAPEEAGNVYRWGETMPASDAESGYVDNPEDGVLPLANDAARQNWGGEWRMPTRADLDALLLESNCGWTDTLINDVACWKVTSKINGKFILLPKEGDYWSSTSENESQSYYLDLSTPQTASGDRAIGRAIRPIQSAAYHIEITATEGGSLAEELVGVYSYGEEIEFAIGEIGEDYYFQRWSDGADMDESPRRIIAMSDTTVTAIFAPISGPELDEITISGVVLNLPIGVVAETITVTNTLNEAVEDATLADNKVSFANSNSFAGETLIIQYFVGAQHVCNRYVKMPFIYNDAEKTIVNPTCDAYMVTSQILTDVNKVNKLTLLNGAKLTIAPKGVLAVEDVIYGATKAADIHVKADATGRGELMMKGYVADASRIKATVEYYAPIKATDPAVWNTIGVPFETLATPSLAGGWVCELVNDQWAYITNPDYTFTAFTGYLITQDEPKLYTMQGELVDADTVVRELPNTYNFLANSWLTSVDTSNLIFDENCQKTVYKVEDGDDRAYPILTDPVYIYPLEAFSVVANASPATLKIGYPTGVGETEASKSASSRRTQAVEESRLTIVVNARSVKKDRLLLVQNAAYTPAFDNGADGTKRFSSNGYPNLSMQYEGGELEVLATNDWDNTVLNFRKGDCDENTLTFTYSGNDLMLKDVRTGTVIDIYNDGTYTFTATDNDMGRFVIMRKPGSGDVATDLQDVYLNEGTLMFANPAGERTDVAIYTIEGKLLETITTYSSTIALDVPARGVYLIQITRAAATKTIKYVSTK